MRRVIYSWYYDIPTDELVSHHESKDKFKEYYDWLLASQQCYARKIDVDYKHFTADNNFMNYQKWFSDNYPEVSTYNVVNFYKIHLMYELAKDYDEILYLDLDVIPVTDLNFFEEFDLSKGIAILSGTGINQKPIRKGDTLKYTHDVRSPMAKLWNSKCMLAELDFDIDTPSVFNTAIVGARACDLHALKYFDDFKDTLNLMSEMITDDFYPETIRCMFGYDNETLWGVKTYINNIKWQELGDEWHYFMDNWSYVRSASKFIHCVSKDFEYVRQWCEKNNIQFV